MSSSAQASLEVVGSSPFDTAFPGATVIIASPTVQGQSGYQYLEQRGNDVYALGAVAAGKQSGFDVATIVKYGNTLAGKQPVKQGDTFGFLVDGPSRTYVDGELVSEVERSGSGHFEVDGEGTLLLPNNKSYSVLRVMIHQELVDSSFGMEISRLELTTWNYYSPTHHFYILSVNSSSASPSQSSATWQTSPMVDVEALPEAKELVVYPNPVKAGTVLKVEGGPTAYRTYRLVGADGKLVSSGVLDAGGQLVLSPSINTGFYVLHTISGKEAKQVRLLVQ